MTDARENRADNPTRTTGDGVRPDHGTVGTTGGRQPQLPPDYRAAHVEKAGNFHEQAALAWERFNPEKVSVPEYEAMRAAWIGGYLAALQDAGFEDD